ncbi:MAG TPA: DUF58 domain-containing protein [Gaiella sp.]
MTARPSPRLSAYSALVAIGLLGALAARRAELAVLAAPFALVLALGLTARPPQPRVRFVLEGERVLEGDPLRATLEVESADPIDRLELRLALPAGVELVADDLPRAFHLGWGGERSLELELRARWGVWTVGDLRLRARDRFGVLWWEERLERPHRLRVVPRPEQLRALVAPAQTQAATGNEVARVRGEGVEFADTRAFVAGDRVRSINWRASARREQLIVNERHPERNTDVVLFLDSFADAERADGSILGRAVRASATLADLYLRRRDRVGLVTFGGTLRWLEPGAGALQRYRLVDALLETRMRFSYAWKDVNVIPARTLPPRALVIAVTPLLDARAVTALLDLRARGHDLAVVEVPAELFAAPGEEDVEQLAWRLWLLRRETLRARLQAIGVAVSRWDDDAPLDAVLEGVRTYRRHARLARR